MTQYIEITNQVRAIAGGMPERASVCATELRSFNQSYVQAAVQAVCQENHGELERILKDCRKLRKAIASLPRTEQESFYYEAGIFIGTYRVFLDMQDAAAVKTYNQAQKRLLERKHVRELLDYLYQNPYACQKNIAAGIQVQPNYLSEILNNLLQAGYVERYGKHKGTQYCLTKLGRQICREQLREKKTVSVFVEAEYREIQDKEKFLEVRMGRAAKGGLRKEDGYAKWKTDFRTYTAASPIG